MHTSSTQLFGFSYSHYRYRSVARTVARIMHSMLYTAVGPRTQTPALLIARGLSRLIKMPTCTETGTRVIRNTYVLTYVRTQYVR